MGIDSFGLTGKKALILFPEADFGAQIALGFCEAGADVFLCGCDPGGLNSVKDTVASFGYRAAVLTEYRQGTDKAAEGLALKAKEEMGWIDCFIYIDPGARLSGWDHEFEEIADAFNFSQTGLMLTVKHIGAVMAETGGGSVLFVTDYAALVGCDIQNYTEAPEIFDKDFSLDYGYVKGSYVNYARQAAGYLGEHGIRCNCIAYAPAGGMKPKGFENAYIKHSHLKRMASDEDIINAAVFFASDASAYITGATLPVDGGYTAK
jgi:NAD(P)-dependent dehydrogenase (short-subunit alcohol dehydrogenase family)